MDTEEKKIRGLTEAEVEKRKKEGLTNGNFTVKTKSIGQIIYSNVFVLFNFVNLFLAACLFVVHSYKNMLFMGVIFWNIFIGVFQEIRSKRIIDKLSLLSEPSVRVLRDGEFQEIKIEDLVLGDVFALKNGNQVCTDSVIVEGECEVNESLLTGESDPVYKKRGDEILSGSFVLSGSVLAESVHVGKDNYVNKITSQAKYIKKPNSQMLKSIQTIIKIVSIVLIPMVLLLFYRQCQIPEHTMEDAVVSTVAAVIGMIPSGLVLLTSVVLAVSVIRLGKKRTLVQELYCIETLARVDTLCLDKTGTITEGVMDVRGVEILSEEFDQRQIDEILYFFTNGLNDSNPTFEALHAYSMKLYEDNRDVLTEKVEEYQVERKISFSSEKKWSLVDFQKRGTYVLGALDFIMGERASDYKDIEGRFARDGVRVLTLAHSNQHCDGIHLPQNLKVYAFILLTDRIRMNASETLRYFQNQGVDIKVISGDNPKTVANIAKRCELPCADRYVDATTLHTEEEIRQAAEQYAVFGRVTPAQKLQLVRALKEKGHTVAMTGDGVNDVMALKEADCSIAMQSGSDAARNVSQLVLMDSDFASMPDIVAEGRRTINNIQRSAALYLTKTIYSVLLAFIFVFFPVAYPFQPIQLTLIGGLGIGIPSFLLAMEPNLNRIKGNFLLNVLKLAIPGGLIVITNVIAAEIFGWLFQLSVEETSTLAFLGLAIASLVELFKVCKPFNYLRVAMCSMIIMGFIGAVTIMGRFFEISSLTFLGIVFVLAMVFITPMLHMVYSIAFGKIMGNTPNVYRICPVLVRGVNGFEKVILVEEDVEQKDFVDVASQMLGLRALRAKRVVYLRKSENAHIRLEDSAHQIDECELVAAAAYYVKHMAKKKGDEDYMTILVEQGEEKELAKVKVDLRHHRTIIETKEFAYRILKRLKLTL